MFCCSCVSRKAWIHIFRLLRFFPSFTLFSLFRLLPFFSPFTLFPPFYPFFRLLPFFPPFTLFSAFYPFFRLLPFFPPFTLFSAFPPFTLFSAFPPFTFFSSFPFPFPRFTLTQHLQLLEEASQHDLHFLNRPSCRFNIKQEIGAKWFVATDCDLSVVKVFIKCSLHYLLNVRYALFYVIICVYTCRKPACGIGKTVLSVSCARFKSHIWKSRPSPTLRQRNICICPCLSSSTQISSCRQAEWTPVRTSCYKISW